MARRTYLVCGFRFQIPDTFAIAWRLKNVTLATAREQSKDTDTEVEKYLLDTGRQTLIAGQTRQLSKLQKISFDEPFIR